MQCTHRQTMHNIWLAALCSVLVNTETQVESNYRHKSEHTQVVGKCMHSGRYLVKVLNMNHSTKSLTQH